jgi:hypothetical protein
MQMWFMDAVHIHTHTKQAQALLDVHKTMRSFGMHSVHGILVEHHLCTLFVHLHISLSV